MADEIEYPDRPTIPSAIQRGYKLKRSDLEEISDGLAAHAEAVGTAVLGQASSAAETAVEEVVGDRLDLIEMTASADASSKANIARDQAIAAAQTDATNKATEARQAAIASANADSTTKANAAQAAAAGDATAKANAAQAAAIAAAATDATAKANAAKSGAESTAASALSAAMESVVTGGSLASAPAGQVPVSNGDGTYSPGGVEVGVVASGDATGATDLAAIQAALTAVRVAGGGVVRGSRGASYVINGPLTIGTKTTLDLSGCSITRLATGGTTADATMIRNYAQANPAATATDAAITSGSNVVTTALGASAAVGQTVIVAGARGTQNGPLTGIVSAKTSTTITIVKYDGSPMNAAATVSGAAIRLHTRDTAIRIEGGLWTSHRGGTGWSSITQHKLLFRHVDGLRLNPEGMATNKIGYLCSIGDVRNVTAYARNLAGTHTLGGDDGLHIEGPARFIDVPLVSGSTYDDPLSFTGTNWLVVADVTGDITDVNIGEHYGRAAINRGLFLVPGRGNLIDRFKVSGRIASTVNGNNMVYMGDDPTDPGTIGGEYGSIDLGLICGRMENYSYLLYLNNPTAKKIVAQLDWSGVATDFNPVAGVQIQGSAVAIDELRVSGRLDISAAVPGSGLPAVRMAGSGTAKVKHLVLDGLKWAGNSAGSASTMVHVTGGAIDVVDFIGCHAHGGGQSSAFSAASSAGVIGAVNFTGGLFESFGAQLIYDELSQDTKYTFTGGVSGAATRLISLQAGNAAKTKTLIFAGCSFNPSSAFVLVNTASKVWVVGSGLPYNAAALFAWGTTPEVRVFNGLFSDLLNLSRSGAGDIVNNVNGARSCGVGLCISSGSGSAGSWKNLSTGATY